MWYFTYCYSPGNSTLIHNMEHALVVNLLWTTKQRVSELVLCDYMHSKLLLQCNFSPLFYWHIIPAKWCVFPAMFSCWLCYVFQSGAKINISDSSCPERIVTVTGTTDQIFKAFSMICKKFEDVRTSLTIHQTNPPIPIASVSASHILPYSFASLFSPPYSVGVMYPWQLLLIYTCFLFL